MLQMRMRSNVYIATDKTVDRTPAIDGLKLSRQIRDRPPGIRATSRASVDGAMPVSEDVAQRGFRMSIERLGHHRPLQQIGAGGMATVPATNASTVMLQLKF
jgi:hypothetical protein